MNFNLLAHSIGRIHTNTQSRTGQAINLELNRRNWLIGAYIVELEQDGEDRAEYGGKVLETLPNRLRRNCFTGFSVSNMRNFRQVTIALSWPMLPIRQTTSGESRGREKGQTPSDLFKRQIRQNLRSSGRWKSADGVCRIRSKQKGRRVSGGFYKHQIARKTFL